MSWIEINPPKLHLSTVTVLNRRCNGCCDGPLLSERTVPYQLSSTIDLILQTVPAVATYPVTLIPPGNWKLKALAYLKELRPETPLIYSYHIVHYGSPVPTLSCWLSTRCTLVLRVTGLASAMLTLLGGETDVFIAKVVSELLKCRKSCLM